MSSISKRKNEPSHYMLKIESFSLLSEAATIKIESDVFYASGHKWKLDLYPNGNREEKGGNHISLYVIICDTETLPKGWEVFVDVNFFIYDHIHHNYATFQDIENGNRTRFNEKKMKWGFHKLISLDSFKKTGNGYLENDSCVFGAEVFAVTEYAQKDRCLSITKPPPFINTHTWTIDNFSDVTETVMESKTFKVGKVECDSTLTWGYRRFMLRSELNDPAKGFLLNGSLILEAEFSLMGILRNFI
ncbi:hypothetical protein OSB04_016005 [Centaurea solstitialis]|uniref:MATH domain-containing protein n=1 Tax=Centaurea solstitialis TaxID=347529 RepID=A0AA38WH16_9ASTR|nr:hypothetical protein OSB04_016005 [Centaurea solstitialis]